MFSFLSCPAFCGEYLTGSAWASTVRCFVVVAQHTFCTTTFISVSSASYLDFRHHGSWFSGIFVRYMVAHILDFSCICITGVHGEDGGVVGSGSRMGIPICITLLTLVHSSSYATTTMTE
jgi:hypothetical protein